MITVLTGDNSFELNEALNALITAFDGRAEKIDGSEIEYKNIPDLLMGGTLFAEKRLVIIKDLSTNKSVWERLPEWLPRLSDDIHLVLVDAKPDKRTVAYKELKKIADVKEFFAWGDRDRGVAENWVAKRADLLGLKLDKKLVVQIVARVGLDQWQLASALEKLSLLDDITAEAIEATIESSPSENVFQLFETALEGHPQKVHDMIKNLELTEDPYKLFALLSSQVFQLAAVANAGDSHNPSKDFAIHPYVASKLARHAKRVGALGSLRILKSFAQADADMKISKADPWILIERALIGIQ
ncbi:MAG: polymerase subunit delta [Candidatus Saccharibacteria bacterium]|nr:polymerase subunit delta [Candidatus Saccharibacteria bacterium]